MDNDKKKFGSSSSVPLWQIFVVIISVLVVLIFTGCVFNKNFMRKSILLMEQALKQIVLYLQDQEL